MSATPLEDAIVEFVESFDVEALTERLQAAARRLIQDQLAVQIGCADLPWSKQILDFTLAQSTPGASRIAAGKAQVSGGDATFVNATYGHGFEYDDAHRASASHPGSCVVSTALAVAEEQGASLEQALVGLIVGYEVYTRIGNLAAPELLSRGFHPHAVLSNFGAAAAAAKLRGYDTETIRHALAIASSHASGLTEYTSSGGSVKRAHSGIGSRNGIRSADMARAGITGPLAFLTGTKGLFRTFLQKEVGVEAAQRFSLEAPFEIEKVWIKPHCCCGCIHAYIDAVKPFQARLADLAGIDVAVQRSANVPVGTKNVNAYTPKNIEHVQFSLPIQLAFTLLGKGNGLQVHRDCLDGRIDLSPDGEVLTAARLFQMTEDETLDGRYPGKFVADVVVRFRDGTSEHVFVEDPIGVAENPVSRDNLDGKFRELTVPVLGAQRAESLLIKIKAFGGAGNAADFTALYSR